MLPLLTVLHLLSSPVLVNVSGFRNIVGFAFTYGIPDWVAQRGYMGAFGIFAGAIAVVAIPLPFFYKYGKRLRRSGYGQAHALSESQ